MSLFNNKTEYSLLHDNDMFKDIPLTDTSTFEQRSFKGIWLPNLILFCISITCLATSAVSSGFSESTNFHLKRTNTYSPLLNTLPIELKTQTVNGSLFNLEKSIFRQQPSKEVDKAWDEMSATQIFTLGSDDIYKLGKDPSKTARAPLSWGRGPDAHIVELDGQHALHCLDAVRRFAYYDHYYRHNYPTFDDLPEIQKYHLSHCLDIVRQALTCQPSTGIVTHHWVETQSYPFPDFNVEKKCVDHGAILNWQNKIGLTPEGIWPEDTAPELDAYIMPRWPEMLAWQEAVEKDGQSSNHVH